VTPTADLAQTRAAGAEDVIVGDQIVRHRLASRLLHWVVALFFFVCLLTGLPIWTPVFGWMAAFFGGLSVCRWLHPWAGALFFVSSFVMFLLWEKEMRLLPGEREWLGPKALRYLRYEEDDPEVGKYNGGQKLFFFAVSLGTLGLLVSGLVLWFPLSFPQVLREAGILLHDLTFILFAVAIVLHIYLGTAAEPGTFQAMTRGTVSQSWARMHHPRWFREVTHGDPPRS